MLTEEILKGRTQTRREYVEIFMNQHSGFHVSDGLWFVKEPFGRAACVLIMKVRYERETSSQPQSSYNERGIIEFAFVVDFNSLASAVACMTMDKSNYHAIIKMLMPGLTNTELTIK